MLGGNGQPKRIKANSCFRVQRLLGDFAELLEYNSILCKESVLDGSRFTVVDDDEPNFKSNKAMPSMMERMEDKA
ncbi:unnamed protein product [Toxocara canis]|uniref:Uncharacterized protein n=1 Tax=Toxocara canis TaxID=6265 RepID=A0A183TUY6_TOXCA|nr:unnamed protein product [Toxocara canis]